MHPNDISPPRIILQMAQRSNKITKYNNNHKKHLIYSLYVYN